MSAPIRIGQERRGELVELRTEPAQGEPALEMVGVPTEAVDEARAALGRIASEVAGQPVTPEEVWGARLRRSVLLVRLIDSPRPATLRAVSPEPDADPSAPPWSAIASEMLDRAAAHLEAGDPAAAERVLRRSLALFEGDPTRPDEVPFGPDHNRENALTYRMLALDLRPDDASELFVAGLRRSVDLAFVEIGGDPRDLEEPSYTHLAELGRFVAYQTLREEPVIAPVGERAAAMRSPIWYLTPRGAVARGHGPWPLAYRALYYQGAAAEALGQEWVVEALIDAFAKQRADPLLLLGRTFATNALWREAAGAPLTETKQPFVPPERLLSVMLAHVGHGIAAGLDRAPIRASLGADRAPELEARATAALRAFEPTLARWRREALP